MEVNIKKPALFIKDDGFATFVTRQWHLQKLRIIQSYIRAYLHRVDLRNKDKILIDIGSGPGIVSIEENNRHAIGTPLLSLSMKERFNKYIFCEKKTEFTNALKIRTNKFFPKENLVIIDGDINQTVEKIHPYLPYIHGSSGGATLCFIDVFSFDVHYDTIQRLAELGVDFLFINAFPHSQFHNYKFYLEENLGAINEFFGAPWSTISDLNEIKSDLAFFMLIIKTYQQQLKTLGYHITGGFQKFLPPIGPVPYYQISYCTKSKLIEKVKADAIRSENYQIRLFG